jgi:predicted amidohydrolase
MNIHLSLVQYAPVLGDVAANIAKLSQSHYSEVWKSEIVILPELASSGYRFQSRDEAFLSAQPLDGSFVSFLKKQAKQNGCCIVSGLNERSGSLLYNSSVMVMPNGDVNLYRKLHLFWDEKDIFQPGDLGVPVFVTPWGKVGMLVCFDWMFPEVWRMMALQGANLVCHPSNLVLPWCQSVIPSYALVNKYYVATTNRVGKERDLEFTGQSIICSPQGEVLMQGGVTDEQVITVEVDLSRSSDKQITPRNHALLDRRVDVYGNFGM